MCRAAEHCRAGSHVHSVLHVQGVVGLLLVQHTETSEALQLLVHLLPTSILVTVFGIITVADTNTRCQQRWLNKRSEFWSWHCFQRTRADSPPARNWKCEGHCCHWGFLDGLCLVFLTAGVWVCWDILRISLVKGCCAALFLDWAALTVQLQVWSGAFQQSCFVFCNSTCFSITDRLAASFVLAAVLVFMPLSSMA